MSKLNPQKATAYVGPGVLKQGGKITPVPDGHLIKKTGKFKGSTLKSGGAIKKAQNSDVIAKEFEDNEKIKDSLFAKNRKLLNLNLANEQKDKQSIAKSNNNKKIIKDSENKAIQKLIQKKAGGMIKRADGSSSKRGLWDNIRAAAKKNKAAGKPGKKPTKQMLVQEKKIKAKSKK